MSWEVLLMLASGGLVGGVVNALAGGATLITFPVMLATGLPPIIANASNAVAVTPGHFIAAIADREKIPARDWHFVLSTAIALIGGVLGAILLLMTPSTLFTLLVPPLIGLATLTFAASRHIQTALASWRPRIEGQRSGWAATAALLGPAAIYGGYFGGGLGVMLIAVLSLTGLHDVRAANAMKNILATAVSVATIAVFSVRSAVSWPETLTMLGGAVLGGYCGGRLIRVLPAAIVRQIVIGVGTLMTVIYAVKYWL
jgi:uncharacterized membrane protein YfcA